MRSMMRDAPRNSAALPPPGPVMSPDDPRYGRPTNGAPAYSDRGADRSRDVAATIRAMAVR